jgi:nucleotide-binding universal stress UspA family protein
VTIVCGIDFSPASIHAAEVAAILAQQHDEQLVLVHAISMGAVPPMYMNGTLVDEMRNSAAKALDELALRLGGGVEGRVATAIGMDPADEVILDHASKHDAQLIVLGSVGHRGLKWLLGSTADRVASRTRVPLFIVRPDFPAAAWTGKKKALRVVVAAELAPSTEPEIEWASHLSQHGPCEFVVTHLSWPPEEYERLAIDAPMHLDRTHPLVVDVVRRELADAAARLERVGPTEVVVESNMGMTAAAITQVAARERADLLVVGRGSDEGRSWWDQSVSRAVVRNASMSVVCVPQVADEKTLSARSVTKVLAATDFSTPGNGALAWALAIAPAGGEVLLIHVVEDGESMHDEQERRREQLERLARSIPSKAKVTVDVVEGEEAARLISAAAERFDADIVCIGSRGRSGLAKALLGSVSQELLLRCARPMLIVPAPRREP